jgi:hypothetical protein
MRVNYGRGTTEYGPGVEVKLTGTEIVKAIQAYLVAHGVHLNGPCTFTINGELIKKGKVYVDPSGFVIHDGKMLDGRGPDVAK